MKYKQKRIIGDCVLYHADCMDILPFLVGVHACLTDPPYGLGEDGGRFRDRKGGGHRILPKKHWDKERPRKEVFDAIRHRTDVQIIWGGNYFTDRLPVSRGWLYWQKLMGGDFSDGELAWTNINRDLKEFTFCNKFGGKVHPTQKPEALMKWCIELLPKDTETILAPFMGSASTLVACAKMGRAGIGIEIDEDYFNIACRRVEEAYSQPDFLIEQPKAKPEQDKPNL